MSDTAYLTAGIRAQEALRSDPAYLDLEAARLAGERGMRFAQSQTRTPEMAWGVTMRTSIIDRLVLEALVAGGVDSVLNLGAGLDMRPYRLAIPNRLLWVEADLPEIVKYKDDELERHKPNCPVRRVAIDLTATASRRRLFVWMGDRYHHTLVLAEGLLPYLSSDDVSAIAGDMRSQAGFNQWIVDFDGAGGKGWTPPTDPALKAISRRFEPSDAISFLQTQGWEPYERVGAGTEAERLGRPYQLGFPRSLCWAVFPKSWKTSISNLSGAALLKSSKGGVRRDQ